MKTNRWARMQQWGHDHPWATTGFFLGIGFGILLCQPLLPSPLPDSSAQLIGSFLGAAIAVTGAIWVTTIKDRRFRTDLRLAAIVIYEPFLNSLAERMTGIIAIDGQTAPLDQAAADSLAFGKKLSGVTRASFEDLRPAFASTPNDIIVHRHLLGAMDRFNAFFDAEFERDRSRIQRQQEDRQAAFNRPDMTKTVPQPVNVHDLKEAIEYSEAVMDTVGK